MFDALSNLPRRVKKLFLVVVDCWLLCAALWVSYFIRLEEWWPKSLANNWELLVLVPIFGIPAFFYFGLYNAVIRYIAPKFLVTILKSAATATVMLFVTVVMGEFQKVPRSVYFLYFVNVSLMVGGLRMLIREFLPRTLRKSGKKRRVIVYGAGAGGTQIANALQASREYRPVAFVDDNKEIQGWEIMDYKVYPPAALASLVTKFDVHEVIIAIPSLSRSRRREIIESMEGLPLTVRTLPGIPDLVAGEVRIDDIREVEIEDLLGRDATSPDESLLKACITGKNVLVSGAGGSIGSELCRQILEQQPNRLVLIEASEYALYRIQQEFESNSQVEIVPILGSVCNRKRLDIIMNKYSVETIYHAAAYKHVPIVEQNLIAGIVNNVMGTYHLALSAVAASVETFILISTDKAVRPSSAMGASKRFSELILQGLDRSGARTRFTMVRFGNVLGSSGSVVPLFREQIRKGGPVTVTHKDMTRYFMTIPEAAQLVIQAGAMGQGGDVFLLDMGEPVKIQDLAAKMIRLSGLTIYDPKTGSGDIEIKTTGKRPGEKLFEELLIGDNTFETRHPRIKRAEEKFLPWETVERIVTELDGALQKCDPFAALQILAQALPSYRPPRELVDLTASSLIHPLPPLADQQPSAPVLKRVAK